MDTSSLIFLKNQLLVGLYALSENPQTIILWLIALTTLYLANKKQNQLIFFLPFSVGIILANIPFSAATSPNSWLEQLQTLGLKTQLLPTIFLFCAGLKCDFQALLKNPKILFFTTFSYLSIFLGTICAATLGLSFTQASAISIIATADLPITIFFVNQIASELIGQIILFYFFYSYFTPTIQTTIIKLLTSKKEQQIQTSLLDKTIVNQKTTFFFPIILIIVLGTLMPFSLSIIGIFLLGNIIKESGAVSDDLEKNLLNITTILLGATIGSLIKVDDFLTDTTLILFYCAIALIFVHTLINIITLKIYNKFCNHKINPLLAITNIYFLNLQQKPSNNHNSKTINSAYQLSSLIIAGLMLSLIPALQKLLGV